LVELDTEREQDEDAQSGEGARRRRENIETFRETVTSDRTTWGPEIPKGQKGVANSKPEMQQGEGKDLQW